MGDSKKQIPLKISATDSIPGAHPIIIIGPNGAGKTRLGASLAEINGMQRIPALRDFEIADIPMWELNQAQVSLQKMQRQHASQYWRREQALPHLLAKLKAENTVAALMYWDEARSKSSSWGAPKDTTIIRLVNFWRNHFPKRSIDLAYRPTAVSELGSSRTPYELSKMSDGESTSLYLAARVLDAAPGVVIIDEPEAHLHPVLARRLWNGLEKERPDCRFVYITHNLAFALSRHNAQFILVEPDTAPQVLSHDTGIPDDVFEKIIGAASFSVTATRIVFCEGDDDEAFYGAWFNDPSTAVFPAGGSEQVQKCVEVFNSSETIKGVHAIGIIDRDYWPDEYLNSVVEGIHVLDVHEIESLLCLRDVFTAVAKHQKIPVDEVPQRYETFLAKARRYFQGTSLNKQILERAKRRVEWHLRGLLNMVSPDFDLDNMKADFESALDQKEWAFDPVKIFTEEQEIVMSAVNGGDDEFLRYLPGKSYYSHAASELGLQKHAFVELITASLLEPEDDQSALAQDLISALENYLPARQVKSVPRAEGE